MYEAHGQRFERKTVISIMRFPTTRSRAGSAAIIWVTGSGKITLASVLVHPLFLNPVRYKNTGRSLRLSRRRFFQKEFLVLTKDNQIEETMFLGLRVLNGVSRKKF